MNYRHPQKAADALNSSLLLPRLEVDFLGVRILVSFGHSLQGAHRARKGQFQPSGSLISDVWSFVLFEPSSHCDARSIQFRKLDSQELEL